MQIGHRKEFKGWRFERSPFVRMIEQYWELFRSDERLTLVTSAFKLFTAGLIYVFNSVDNTKLPY